MRARPYPRRHMADPGDGVASRRGVKTRLRTRRQEARPPGAPPPPPPAAAGPGFPPPPAGGGPRPPLLGSATPRRRVAPNSPPWKWSTLERRGGVRLEHGAAGRGVLGGATCLVMSEVRPVIRHFADLFCSARGG